VSIELLLNRTGTVRATFFYRENADMLGGGSGSTGNLQTRRYGASISYGREFDGNKARGKKKKAKDTIQTSAAIPPKDSIDTDNQR
jgi:hypothetical protein